MIRIQISDKYERDTNRLMHVMINNIHSAREEELRDMERSQGMIIEDFKRKHQTGQYRGWKWRKNFEKSVPMNAEITWLPFGAHGTRNRDENTNITRACNWALRHSSWAKDHRDVYGFVPWDIAIECIKHRLRNQAHDEWNNFESWGCWDWLNALSTCISPRFIIAWRPLSERYIQDQASRFDSEKPTGWPLPWAKPLRQTTWDEKQYPDWQTFPTHIAAVQGHSQPGCIGYTDIVLTPEITQYIPTLYHVTKWWKARQIIEWKDSLKPSKDVEGCDKDRTEVFGTGLDPTIPTFTVPREEETMIRELAAKGILLTQYKQGSDYFKSHGELDKVAMEYDLDQAVRDGHHFVYKSTGAITAESAILFEYYRKTWDIHTKRMLNDTADAQWTEQKEWKTKVNPTNTTTNTQEHEPGPEPEGAGSMDGNYTEDTRTEPDMEMDPAIDQRARHFAELPGERKRKQDKQSQHTNRENYDPKYEDRPTICFKEVWGDCSWKVEYYGEYDNDERQKHVAIRLNHEPPKSHIHKVKAGDQFSLHNLRKGSGKTE